MIRYLKSELTTARTDPGDEVKLTLDECAIELNIAVKREAKGDIKAYVVTIGGGISSAQTHKISAKFKPTAESDPNEHIYETGSGASPSKPTAGPATSRGA